MDDSIVKPNERILRIEEVTKMTGFGRSSLYLKEQAGDFPKRIKISAKSVGWLESEVNAWILAKIKESREKTKDEKSEVNKTL